LGWCKRVLGYHYWSEPANAAAIANVMQFASTEAAMCSAALTASRVPPAILARIKHGSHLCAFYETKEDLIDLVLPFFDGGLSWHELCVWMTPDSVSARDAASIVAERRIEVQSARSVYMRDSHFEREPVVDFWDNKLQEAIATSHSGLRASGDAFWLHRGPWSAFLDYEADINNMIADKPIALLCTYPLSVSASGDIYDVACTHHVAIAKRRRDWEIIKGWGLTDTPVSPQQKRTDALDAANRVLSLSRRERQVLDRIAEGRANKEIAGELMINPRTVEMHRARLLNRLGVRTMAEAVRLATLARLVLQE
jgi:DNA-binding CsgD family transcriptional regulator